MYYIREKSEGYAAYYLDINKVPYKQKSESFKNWWRGWYEAEDDDAVRLVDDHFIR